MSETVLPPITLPTRNSSGALVVVDRDVNKLTLGDLDRLAVVLRFIQTSISTRTELRPVSKMSQ